MLCAVRYCRFVPEFVPPVLSVWTARLCATAVRVPRAAATGTRPLELQPNRYHGTLPLLSATLSAYGLATPCLSARDLHLICARSSAQCARLSGAVLCAYAMCGTDLWHAPTH
eukprot:2301845-Rhodomonas_salina.2